MTRTHRTHDSEEPVSGHEDEGVDADVGERVDEVLDGLAPEQSERPVVDDVVRAGKGDAQDDEEQVGRGEVQDQHVRRVPHLLVRQHLRGKEEFREIESV